MTEGVREKITRALREFGFNPKGCAGAYQKPKSPEVGVWKDNVVRRPPKKIKPMCNMLINKYVRQQQQQREMHEQTLRFRRYRPGRRDAHQRTMFPRSTGIGEHGAGNREGWDEHGGQVLASDESGAHTKLVNVAGRAEDVVMTGSVPCKAVRLNDGTKGEIDVGQRMVIGIKRQRTLTTEGREVVGLEYSTCTHTTMGSNGQLKRQRAEGGTPQNSDCARSHEAKRGGQPNPEQG
jgi:hypothetical protein